MEYRVHRLEVSQDSAQNQLQDLLDGLEGEVVSVVPMVTPTFQFMGATAKVAFLLIVEKLDWPDSRAVNQASEAESETRLLPHRSAN